MTGSRQLTSLFNHLVLLENKLAHPNVKNNCLYWGEKWARQGATYTHFISRINNTPRVLWRYIYAAASVDFDVQLVLSLTNEKAWIFPCGLWHQLFYWYVCLCWSVCSCWYVCLAHLSSLYKQLFFTPEWASLFLKNTNFFFSNFSLRFRNVPKNERGGTKFV